MAEMARQEIYYSYGVAFEYLKKKFKKSLRFLLLLQIDRKKKKTFNHSVNQSVNQSVRTYFSSYSWVQVREETLPFHTWYLSQPQRALSSVAAM